MLGDVMRVSDCIERRAVSSKSIRNYDSFNAIYNTQRGRRVEVEEVPSSPAPSSKADSAELADIRHSLKDLRDENQKLQAVVNDVMEVNKRWQRHHSDRELYVQKLLNTISDLQVKAATSRSSDHVTSVKETSRLAGVSASTERLAQLEAENAQLRLDVESARRKVQALEQEHREHAELLEIQVRSYKDDWEAERREKEQAVREKKLAEEKGREISLQMIQLQKKFQERETMNIPVASSSASSVTHRCCPHSHLCESSSAPVVSSAHCCGSNSGRSTTFRTSVHLPSLSQVQLRESRLPENIALDGVSRVSSSIDSRLSSTLDSRPDSPLASETSVNASSAPITIGFEDGLASVQTFSFPTPSEISSKKMSVLQIAAPPVSTDVFKEWQKQPNKEDENGILTQTRENISCPRCGRVFPPEKHLKFLDHFDECHEHNLSSNFCDVK